MKKIAQLSVRITPEELVVLRELAAKQSIRLSEFVRRTLAHKATESAPDAGLLQRLAGAMRRVGVGAP